MQRLDWIAVDWGTSRLRAFAMGANDIVVAEKASDDGMGRLSPDCFEGALHKLIDPWISGSEPISILACGMVGARTGWIEAPYLDVPADLGALALGAVKAPVRDSRLAVRILPGLNYRDHGPLDIMRGEETQLLGFASLSPGYEGLVCLPGTHAKWASLQGRHIARFQTFMTGELFEILTHNGLLAQSTGDNDWEEDGFGSGAEQGLSEPAAVTASLFRVRVNDVLGHKSKGWCRAWLSGLLIGAEIAAATNMQRGNGGSVPLIGTRKLTEQYGRAFSIAGLASDVVSGKDAVLAGLKAARATMMEAA